MAPYQLPRGFIYCRVVFSAVQLRFFLLSWVVSPHFSLSQFDDLRLYDATELFGRDRAIARADFNSATVQCVRVYLPQFAN
jgi:hypothetical protein